MCFSLCWILLCFSCFSPILASLLFFSAYFLFICFVWFTCLLFEIPEQGEICSGATFLKHWANPSHCWIHFLRSQTGQQTRPPLPGLAPGVCRPYWAVLLPDFPTVDAKWFLQAIQVVSNTSCYSIFVGILQKLRRESPLVSCLHR
jgi:hypothetical protein